MSSLRVFLVVAGVLLGAAPSFACLRWLEDGPLARPKPLSVWERLQQRTSPGEWQDRARDLGKSADAVWNYTTENNLSVALAHVGRLDEALERMQTIERAAPGHIETAYNMATVYELRGDLPGAKKWLEEGFRRERGVTGRAPLDGTEWLHERILDAEMQPSKGAASVAGLDFGAAKTPQMPSDFPSGLDDKPVDFAIAKRSLFEQLHERLEFVSAPNPIVGDLLLDLANAQALEGANSTPGEDSGMSNDEQVAQLLQQALVYGTPRASEARRRLAYYSGQPNWPLILTPLALLSAGAFAWWWARKRREREMWAALPVAAWEPPKPLPHLEWKDEDFPRG